MNEVTVLVAGLVLFHVVIVALAPLTNDHRRRAFRRRFHVSMRPLAITWKVALVACILLVIVGEIPLDRPIDRWEVRAVGFQGMLLAGGTTIGAAVAVGGVLVGRRVIRLRFGENEPPGDLVVTGRAVPVAGSEPEPSPVFERPAVCWAWTFEYRISDLDGSQYPWTTARSGSGGAPIRVEPDSGGSAVTIDPAVAHVSVSTSESTVQSPEAPAPGRIGRLANTDIGGSEHRYSEGVIAPDERVTVVGEVDADGRVIDDGDLEPWIAAGDRAAVVRRLQRRAAGYLAVGVASLLVAGPGYLSWLGLR